MKVKRGDIFYGDLGAIEEDSSEQRGLRPVLVLQNNTGNKFSPTVIVAAITTKHKKEKQPTHVELEGSLYGMEDSVIMLEQIRTLDKTKLKDHIASLLIDDVVKVNKCLMKSLAL